MTLALSPTVKRICFQLSVARSTQKRSQADAAKVAGLSIKGLTTLYAGMGSPSLLALDSLARWHGLGHITVIAKPAVIDDKMLNCANPLPLLQMLNTEQTFRRIKQQSLRAESRFIYLTLGLGHRTLSSASVADMVYNIAASASDVDIKARILSQGGLCLRNRFVSYGANNEFTLDLDGAVAMPNPPANSENHRVAQGRVRDVVGQTNDTASDVPSADEAEVEIDPELAALLSSVPTNINQG